MEQILVEHKNAGYLETKIVDGNEIFHLSTPCRFRVTENIVSKLKIKYKADEEIGGVLWARPTSKDGEIIHIIDKVSFIRNAIEDKPRNDDRNKSNAYYPDGQMLNQSLNEVFSQGYLPVKFHSHPVKGTNFLHSLAYSNIKTETSTQDKLASSFHQTVGNIQLVMPRALIVGNDVVSRDIFIGVYNGFIAPTEFKNSKNKIQQENLQKIADLVSSINLTDGEELGLAIGAILLLAVIVKYPQNSLPVILGLCAILPLLLTNTHNINNPDYFNMMSSGSADIFIPKY